MRRSMSRLILVFSILVASAPSILAECSRKALLTIAARYVEGQASGKFNLHHHASSNFTYIENNYIQDFNSSVLTRPLKIDYSRSTADPVECASYTEIVSATGPVPYVIATQIVHEENGTVSAIDSIVASTGALRFNATQTLRYFQTEDWSVVPKDKRSSREELQAVIDAYLDMWSNATAINAIPFGTPCERVEGSTRVSPCTGGAPRGGFKENTLRRYVIDEHYGSADVLCSFTAIGDIPDSHEIRMEGGKVRYVHTITLSSNYTAPPLKRGTKGFYNAPPLRTFKARGFHLH